MKKRTRSCLKWTALVGLLGVAIWSAALRWVPFPDHSLARLDSSAVLTDRHGEVLRVKLAAGDFDCRPSYVAAPEHWIVKALISAEDRRFWEHSGVDVLAMARASSQNISSGRRISGASTLSTQVFRMAEPRRRVMLTKLIESFRAVQMEQRLTKIEILGQYLNRAPFGGNLVGIEAAAQRYFSKSAEDLSLAEAALLAGLPQAPSRLRPDRHPEAAKKRQAYVLERMEACGWITTHEREQAFAQVMDVQLLPTPFRAPHFCDLVGVPVRTENGSTIRTTLDWELQQRAESLLQRHLASHPAKGGAIVVLEVETGAVRAMAGSPDFFAATNSGQVNGAMARRAAGSTLKPFAYALAMDRGLVVPATVIPDVPLNFRDLDPQNFSQDFRGSITVRDSLVASRNLPAIEIERRMGQPLLWSTLRSLGLTSIDRPAAHYGLGLVLGNAEVRLLDLANAYSCLAREGQWAPVRVIESAKPPMLQPRFSPEACWLVSDMLSGDERAMDTTGHAAAVRLPQMAWKTGTSAGLRDAWTVAWNPEFVVGVWAGNPDGAPAEGLIGREVATPIAWDLFRQLYPDNHGPWFARPAGIVPRELCAVSGCTPGAHCASRKSDWAIAQVSRREICPVHRSGEKEIFSAAVASFLAPRTTPAANESSSTLRIVTPARGSTYRRVDGLKHETQSLSLSAVSDQPGEMLYWFINDRAIGKSRPSEKTFWPLERGTHQIVCSNSRGIHDRVEVVVE